ncbi:glycosyl hydrolase [Kocuria sp. CNJ-770]|uniref:glycosyl hydrolase n=1 Tax=Kocuria sp. CNJ-770 TaxID=1904964 RepID=UPI000B27C1D0
MKESTLVAVVVVGALALGGGTIATQLSARAEQEAQAAPPVCTVLDRSELAPGSGALYGVNLDWEDKPLADYADRLGHRPAVSVSFTGFPYDERGHDYLRMAADQVRADGQMLLLTLEPEGGLDEVTDDAVQELTADLAAINDSGVPVIVRFAHEMNGSWYAWGQQPAAYVEAYRRVAEAVHEHAPGSAMMWAPNYGGGYPFAGGQYEAEPGTADFAALDTDGNGELTMADDPYAPYYPGDDAVDWVGMSLYHWGDAHPGVRTSSPSPGSSLPSSPAPTAAPAATTAPCPTSTPSTGNGAASPWPSRRPPRCTTRPRAAPTSWRSSRLGGGRSSTRRSRRTSRS